MMMFVLAGILLLSACGSPMSDAVEAKDAWARTGMMGGNSAAYMMLVNGTGQDVELIGASSDVAEAVEVHLSQMTADGVMQMIQQDAVAIPSKKMLELKPGSYHIMLIGLKQDLNVGNGITVTLHFNGYEDVTLTVPVKDAADMGGSGMDGHNMP
ncbi:MAG TPA: copper chaperone PCu(A)C [Anaerolineales bacterium]|nr:copper chaperone PCu(A)C [Anaerolineales bacterium]